MAEVGVTGATGQIGRWVVAALLRRGHGVVVALRDPAGQGPALRHWLGMQGVDTEGLSAVALDLDRLAEAHTDTPPHTARPAALDPRWAACDTVMHLAARFGWGLTAEAARRTNVRAALALLQAFTALGRGHQFIHLSGYMVHNHAHLRRLGLTPEPPADWGPVYRQVGAYEASKLEAHQLLTRWARAQGAPLTVVHPATVAGHSGCGEIAPGSPLAALGRQLRAGRLPLVPGSADHVLPLVAVDLLADLLVSLVGQDAARGLDLLALDPATPALVDVLGQMATALGRRPPRHHLPLPWLDALLRLPGAERWLETSRESLAFIGTQRYDTSTTDAWMHTHGLSHPPLAQVLTQTARFLAAQPDARDGLRRPGRLAA